MTGHLRDGLFRLLEKKAKDSQTSVIGQDPASAPEGGSKISRRRSPHEQSLQSVLQIVKYSSRCAGMNHSFSKHTLQTLLQSSLDLDRGKIMGIKIRLGACAWSFEEPAGLGQVHRIRVSHA